MVTLELIQQGFSWATCQLDTITLSINAAETSDIMRRVMSSPGLSLDDIAELVQSENTFFSLIARSENETLVACDRIRSMPLFYRATPNKVWIGNNLKVSGDLETLDTAVIAEFKASGFVTQSMTVLRDTKQVQAGEIIRIDHRNGNKIFAETYTRLNYQTSEQKTHDSLTTVTNLVCADLIEFARGRQIVLPLSGGSDSRLLLISLHEAGYKNILAFTYGMHGNPESEISRKIAESLDVKWVFYAHDPKRLTHLWNHPQRLSYEKFSFNGVSLPHYQDFFAIWELKEAGHIDDDAIFVPGHSADFNAGSHLPDFIFENTMIDRSKLFKHLCEKHFMLSGDVPLQAAKSVNDILGADDQISPVNAAEILDNFNMRERQAKFIVNSCRVYEHFGHEWWMPFWDKRFVAYWCALPLSERQRRSWYVEYIAKRSEAIGMEPVYRGRTASASIRTIKKLVYYILGDKRATRIAQKIRIKNHILNPYIFFNKNTVDDLVSSGSDTNGIFTADIAKNLEIVAGHNAI